MTLLHRFQEILDEYRQQLPEIEQRVAKNTSEIERLLAQNAEDQGALASLARDIQFLEREIATMGEHVADAPSPPPVQSSTDTRTEVDSLIKARREAEQAERERQQTGRRRQRSKPDPVKAAKKAARKQAEQTDNPRRLQRDPLVVHAHTCGTHVMPKGIKRPRLKDLRPDDIDPSAFTPTEISRSELLLEVLADQDGAATQPALARYMADLMDCRLDTAQSIVSRALKIAIQRRQVLHAGMAKDKPDDRNSVSLWKLVSVATPPELASAGLGTDDENYAGTTTRWPTASSVSPGARITVESSQFEGKR